MAGARPRTWLLGHPGLRQISARRLPRIASIPPDVVPKVRARWEKHAQEVNADVGREVRAEAKGPRLCVDAVRVGAPTEPEWFVTLGRLGFIWIGEFLWDSWFYSYAHERHERNLTMDGRYRESPEGCVDSSEFDYLTGGSPTMISGTVYSLKGRDLNHSVKPPLHTPLEPPGVQIPPDPKRSNAESTRGISIRARNLIVVLGPPAGPIGVGGLLSVRRGPAGAGRGSGHSTRRHPRRRSPGGRANR